jgi:DNA-binding Lrp family transcriptional regulator
MKYFEGLLDEKDRKILAELDRNARQTDSEIARKVRISKQVANYRIKNLVDKGIISNFYTLINVGELGFSSYYLFFQFENLNEKEEKSLLEQIKSRSYVGWLVSGTGRWDAVILIYAKSASDFNIFLNELLELCANRVHEYRFTSLISAEHIGYKFLNEKNLISAQQTDSSLPLKLDKTDRLILKTISQNARLSVVDISEKLKMPIHVAHYHLKELLKKNVIEAFKPKIEVNKLGLQWHLLLVQFSAAKEARRREFIDFCHVNSRIYYVTNTIGEYNLMLDIHVKDTEEFRKVLFDLKEKFSDVIKIYESIIIFHEYKIDYFTDLFL